MVRNPVILGRISGLYGVRGWVKLFSYTEPREALLDYGDWLVGNEGAWLELTPAEGRRQGKALVARFAGTDDRDAASRFVGAAIAVERDNMPETAQGEYYWSDLEGMQVRRRDGHVLGHVAYMLATGAHDVMVLRAGQGEDSEILIPFVLDQIVLAVDVEAGVIDVDWEWD